MVRHTWCDTRGSRALLVVLVVVVGATFPIWWFRFLVGYALYDLHDLFERGSLMWGMVHTNFWILFSLLGALAGMLHKWAREEHLLSQGLVEYRAWRRGGGRPGPPTQPILAPRLRGQGAAGGREPPAKVPGPQPFSHCQPSTGRSDVGSDCPLVPRSATPDDILNKGPAHLLGRQRRGAVFSKGITDGTPRLPTSPHGSGIGSCGPWGPFYPPTIDYLGAGGGWEAPGGRDASAARERGRTVSSFLEEISR